MYKNYRNVVVKAENSDGKDGFDVYLEFSGQREYLMHHRHNGLVFYRLANGIRIEELRRANAYKAESRRRARNRRRAGKSYICGKNSGRSQRADNSFSHLMVVIDDYLTYRDEYAA